MLDIPSWQRWLIALLVAAGLALAMPNLFYPRVERHNDAAVAIERGAFASAELQADLDAWPGWLPSGLVNLGLDLRGGAHLLAEVQVEDVYQDRMDALWPELRDALAAARADVGPIRRQAAEPGRLRVRLIERPEAVAEAARIARDLARPVSAFSGMGASDLVVSIDGPDIVVELSEEEKAATDTRTLQQSVEIVRRRVDEVGTREPTIQRQGTDRVLIQVPGFGSAAELKDLIGTTARLTFHPVVREATGPGDDPGIGNSVLPSIDRQGEWLVVETAPVVSGEQLVDAQPGFDQNGQPAVNFRFNPSGGRIFGDYTLENVGQRFAIVLDDEVISAPVIRSHIPGGSGQITGSFTVEEAGELAVLLRAGALPAEMIFLEERTIGPELGQDSIEAGKLASIVALVAVLVFMILAYGLFGVFACIALLINMALLFGVLSLIGATLTLPGIAGIVLTIGMAVDANVLVFERIREELRKSKGPARAIDMGYRQAWSAIVDANITTLIAAAILFAMGSGPVRGFAVTLGIGIVTSVFSALFVTRLLIVWWFERRRPRAITV
jgi:preprotein translocase subunit SecD